jgi:hypothetical protein
MKNTKFLVKVNRGGARAAEYVLRVDRSPIQTTTNRKLALAMEIHGRRRGEIHAKLPLQPGVSVSTNLTGGSSLPRLLRYRHLRM